MQIGCLRRPAFVCSKEWHMIEGMTQTNGKQEHSNVLINHQSLIVLSPYMQSFCKKGLQAITSGQQGSVFSKLEIYVASIWDRISELDNSLSGLRMALRLVEEVGAQCSPKPEVYRYHYENFVLRVIGCFDRAYRLVGSALLIDKKRLEGNGGNSVVKKYVQVNHADIYAALEEVGRGVEKYREPRNELIHNSAYLSRELMLIQNAKLLRMDAKGLDVDFVAREYFLDMSKEMEQTIDDLFNALNNLIDVLAPIFFEHAEERSNKSF